ncbi:hypothetical protein F5Y08DRAFT_331240 [Xylaria arbuscula]|uniref:Rhodopsin domain-containing protein n=1 Tax=Xylaria arbuscula TaxID=114810 RepID=A0A9W8NMD1_9PEZI|nr:hypothetical protein F5Y08DRAFT_331240 [Xylaria arbuscula]KAJ3579102.1 hypothetical protein NPX13_g1463 [Xylaria arbuscula]
MSNPYYTPSYNPYPSSVLIGTAILFIIIPVAAVTVRFYARLTTAARLGIDDWLVIPAVVLCVAIAIVQLIAATAGGLGSHQQLDEQGLPGHTSQLYIYEKTRYAYEVIGAAGLCFIKLSVLFFFRRIFRVRAFILINNVVIGLTAAWGISYLFALAFQCPDPSLLWNKLESEYALVGCVNVLPLYLSFAFSDLILDVIIFILPVPHLYNLVMPTRQKIGVASIFFLGSLVVSIGIVRTIIYVWVVDFASNRPLLWFGDLTWYSSGVLFWHLAENAVGVLCACMPSFAPLIKSKIGGTTKSKSSRNANTSGSSNKMTPQPLPYYERIDDESLLHRPGSGPDEHGYEAHALGPIHRGGNDPRDDYGYNARIHAT